MSTRAVYTFKDKHQRYSVYKHYDGYLSGAAEFIYNAVKVSWADGQLSGVRFEADDLAAAFVAANKKSGGDVYLTKNANSHGDLSYDYVIYYKNDDISIDAYKYEWNENSEGGYDKTRKLVYRGTFSEFYAKHAEAQSEAAQ